MKYLLLFDLVNPGMLEKLIAFYNEHHADDCFIILNTRGGDSHIAETIVHMLNQMPKATLLILSAYSSGFSIAYQATCKILLSHTSKGMWHYGRTELFFNTKAKPYFGEDECSIRNLAIDKKIDEALAKKVMTPTEYKKFLKDEEVYFDHKRMKQIFPHAKVLK